MKAILREERSGVSEVLGTILILTMTVVLFSVVILWVSSVPTPTAQTRVDVQSELDPVYSIAVPRVEIGVNITLTHEGGESLNPASTIIYLVDVNSAGLLKTDTVTLHLFNARLANPNGLLDGTDAEWDIGERWAYSNGQFRSGDTITVTVVDTSRGITVWSSVLNPPAGSRPPVFASIWTDGVCSTQNPDAVQAGLGFCLFAKVTDPDGDLNPNSVFATLTAWYGSGTSCSVPLQMKDDGVAPDWVSGDGVFALGNNVCMNSPYPALTWSGTLILLNATDMKGHETQTRIVLDVGPQVSGLNTFNQTTIPSALWQYIGYVQIRTGEVWVSNLSQPYNTASTYQPFRVTATQLNANGGALFHFKMANHGNTTIFIDGWTEAFFQNTQSASGYALYIMAPCSTTIAANAGGVAAYPGSTTNINDFEYARTGLPVGCVGPPSVFDINPFNQEQGGTPYTVMVYNKVAFGAGATQQWKGGGITYYMSILASGMAGPVNYTYAMLTGTAGNPYGCGGLGPNYNPLLHLADPIKKCRSTWYAQVIPFIGIVVY